MTITGSTVQKHFLYSELAKLIEAGFGIREAADAMLDTHLPSRQIELLEGVKSRIESGESITLAFSGDPSIGSLESSIIGAGERGGRLGPAFQHLANYFGMLASSRSRLIRGLMYPIVLLHFGIIIAVVPSTLMLGAGLSSAFGKILLLCLLAYLGIFLLYLCARWIGKTAPRNATLDGWLNQIPFIGKARQNFALARFTQVYHICLLAGLSIDETIRIASTASHSGTLLQSGKSLEATARQGSPVGPEMLLSPEFPRAFARSYTTAEESGTLDKDLGRWSALFTANAEDTAATVAAVIPKVCYVLILIFIFWQIFSFYSGYYYEMLDSIE